MVRRSAFTRLIAAFLLLAVGTATAQTLYKYQGDNGEWIYADRPPADGSDAEIQPLTSGGRQDGVSVTHSFTGSGLQFVVSNRFHAPVELALIFDSIEGVDYPHPDDDLRWVIPARSDEELLHLPLIGAVAAPSVQYRYVYLPGDPAAHPDDVTYRAPFAAGTRHSITQAYPVSDTHRTRDSMYAIDFAMPVGTGVMAARDGVVFEVASTNFKGGPNASDYANLANLVRILHDDGTFAVYAHLNWNSIRVSPGQRVQAGQYIADSGSTGFSSGPHLHFAVQRNLGMRVESLPVSFRGADGARVAPVTGSMLTAYP